MKTSLLSISACCLFALFSCNNNATESVVEEELTVEAPIIQVLEPVKWTYNTEKVGDLQYKITFNATIEDSWYLYSSNIDEDGPISTTIYFNENDVVVAYSDITESGDVTKDGYDEMFDMDIKKFGHAATFSQTITTSGPTSVSGYMEFMTCDSMQCLFPDPIEFTFDAK
jgi:thiol:disulfide interchange protein DsbD